MVEVFNRARETFAPELKPVVLSIEAAEAVDAICEAIDVTEEMGVALQAALAGEAGATVAAERMVRDWLVCGGLYRRFWPKAGGIDDQPSEVVYWFHEIDGIVSAKLAKAGKEQ